MADSTDTEVVALWRFAERLRGGTARGLRFPVGRWFLAGVGAYPGRSLALVAMGFFGSVAEAASIGLLIPLVDALVDNAAFDIDGADGVTRLMYDLAGLLGAPSVLVSVAVLLLAAVVVRATLGYCQTLLESDISGTLGCAIRSRIHANLTKAPFEFVCVSDNGALLNTLDGEAWTVAGAVASCYALVCTAIMAMTLTGMLFLISWKLTLAVALMMVATGGVASLFGARLRRLGEEGVELAAELSSRALDLFDGMRVIRAFGREAHAQVRYDRASLAQHRAALRRERLRAGLVVLQEGLQASVFVATIFCGLAWGSDGATLIAYLVLLHRLQPHVRALLNARALLSGVAGSAEAVERLLDLPQEANGTGKRLHAIERELEFSNVSFSYRLPTGELRSALEGASMTIPIGGTTAIVGSSGAGKSTLTNLLLRFYEPQSGEIRVDGVPLAELERTWWRGQLAVAGQDADLIRGTIHDNIAYGANHADDEEIVAVAKAANIHDFIVSLPQGYHSPVGDHGVLLSGGQRQRVGLARAFLRRAPILILDEATNALDGITEHDVMNALERLKRHATVIVIAHRLATTRNADTVIVLERGKVVEAGTPADLVRNNGLYARMVQLQTLAVFEQGADALGVKE